MFKSSKEYLEEALEKLGNLSGTEKAKKLKIAQNTLSQYRSGARAMDDFACIMVARVLEIDPMRIIAACQEEREKSEERREFWRDFRKTLGVITVAPLAAMVMLTMNPETAQAAPLDICQRHFTPVYYVKYGAHSGHAFATLPPSQRINAPGGFPVCNFHTLRNAANA